jgi:short-subunit dehydrogenase
MTNPRPVTLITGASAGIGVALAQVFAAHGHELVLIARREPRLVRLADEIADQGRPRPIVLPLDLERPDAVARIDEALAAQGMEPDVVVNNAGFGLLGQASVRDRAEQLAMVDLNVRALTDLSLAWVDSLVRHRGGILNVASIASFLPGPHMAVYHASKAYVLSFSEALHRELKPRGVRVTALCPGPVPTEFQERAGIAKKINRSVLTRSAEQVALEGYRGLEAGRRLVVPGLPNKALSVLSRLAPRALVLALADRHHRDRG